MPRSILTLIFLLVGLTAAAAQGWKAGDKVQAWNVDWYDGTIAEIGSGTYAGYYLVKFDRYSTPQYVKAANIRIRPGAAPSRSATAGADDAPRPGRYVCMGYSGGVGQFRWYLQLAAGSYQQKVPDLAAGSYSFDTASRRLTFRNGPYGALNWIGLFTVERGGKTHRIVLRDKAAEAQGPRVREYANIICTNSTDS
jgi:hypothetical protein